MHNITVGRAMERIGEAIRAAHGPGSYQDAWIANIAMPILDVRGKLDLTTHDGANAMALILLEHFFPKERPKVSIASPTERAITESKQWRADLDAVLQSMKVACTSAERSTATRKLKEAIMWLGMDLKEINESRAKSERVDGPYSSSYEPTSTKVEPTVEQLEAVSFTPPAKILIGIAVHNRVQIGESGSDVRNGMEGGRREASTRANNWPGVVKL